MVDAAPPSGPLGDRRRASPAWLAQCDGWLDRDLGLLRDADGFRPVVSRADLQIGSRPMPDDPNLLFRWRLPLVDAPAAVVLEGFVHRLLDHHEVWTREFAGGRELCRPAPGVRVLQQRFDPGIPGIRPRDVCSAEVVRRLDGAAVVVSYRSVDEAPVPTGHVRLDWWGAVLITPLDAGTCELVYLDRENQGGRFPARLMNRLMPRYLVLQAEAVRRFFAGGGPEHLRPAVPPPG